MNGAGIRKIIHVDMDAFFASVEQRDDPALRGRPVAVGHSTSGGVVVAASYEARVFGVRSAMPSVTARRLCRDLVFVPTRFEVYREVSRQIHEIFARYTDLIQPMSLDEAYLDVTENRRGLPTAWRTAKEIRAAIFAETGLTASAGISYNKLLAKLASDHRKPDGQFAVTPEMGPDWVATLPVERFHGIGPKTTERMHRLGIRTGADLRAFGIDRLREHFGSAASWYDGISRAEDDRPVEADRVRKSSGTETTFSRGTIDPEEVRRRVDDMAEKAWRRCETRQISGRTVTLKVKYADFLQLTRRRSRSGPVVSRDELGRIAAELFEAVLPLRQPVRLVGITLSGLTPLAEEPEAPQLPLGVGESGPKAPSQAKS